MVKTKMKKVSVSPEMSLELFDMWTYIKGRKRGLVALVATGLALFIQDNELVALVAGLVAEGLFALGDFYINKVEVKQ